MKIIKNILIQGKHNKPIITDFFFKDDAIKKPIIIFCHGYKGYKDWGAWNLMAEEFVKNNFFFVKFNFSHNGGTVENPIDFPDLEAFSNNNYMIELDDLESVINYILNDKTIAKNSDNRHINLIGHSRGGGIVSLKAYHKSSISSITSWNGISDIEARFPKGEALKQWEKNDIGYVENSRTKQQMPNKFQVYENFIAHKTHLHIKTAIENIKIPHLIVQGTEDNVVLESEAIDMHHWNPKSTLELIKNMNHGLGNTQPWPYEKMPNDLAIVVKKTINFIKKYV
ncbi:MAG: alpha/beta hydrolase [Flavobacteriaceae bacterium]